MYSCPVVRPMEFCFKRRHSSPHPNNETSRENKSLCEYHLKQVTFNFRTNKTPFFVLIFLKKSLKITFRTYRIKSYSRRSISNCNLGEPLNLECDRQEISRQSCDYLSLTCKGIHHAVFPEGDPAWLLFLWAWSLSNEVIVSVVKKTKDPMGQFVNALTSYICVVLVVTQKRWFTLRRNGLLSYI